MKYISIISLALLVGMSACKKEDEHEHDHEEEATTSATISVSSPIVNDTIASAAFLNVTGTITGTTTLHGYDVEIKNITADSVVYSATNDVHSASYTLNYQWTNNVLTTANMSLKIKAYHDHDHQMWDEKMISFVCKQP